jgi:hypothetical protein
MISNHIKEVYGRQKILRINHIVLGENGVNGHVMNFSV